MFAKIFEALYIKVLVNIVRKSTSTLVYIELHSKKGMIEHLHNEFDTTTLDEAMIEFITTYTKESPYYYISVLDSSSEQGAIPTCNKNKINYYTDLSDAEYKCFDGKWTYYTSKSDIYEIEEHYKAIGVDFIFSPFLIMHNFFQDKITKSVAIYALVQDGYISISVFNEGELLYAEHLDMQASTDTDEMMLTDGLDVSEEDLDLESGIDLENIDVEGDENAILDDLSDIEDLDALEDIDEFSDAKDVEEELLENEEEILKEAEEQEDGSFNEDYQRFSLIQTAISHFYKDARYESQFLENIYIADCVGVSRDLKKYLEEEMFLNVYIRKADIEAELCELAKQELGI